MIPLYGISLAKPNLTLGFRWIVRLERQERIHMIHAFCMIAFISSSVILEKPERSGHVGYGCPAWSCADSG
jgi:hypothetical protein